MVDTTSLPYWLGQLYKYHVVEGHDDNSVIGAFQSAMNETPALKTAASSYLSNIRDDVLKRDFITRKNKEFLTTALGD